MLDSDINEDTVITVTISMGAWSVFFAAATTLQLLNIMDKENNAKLAAALEEWHNCPIAVAEVL